MQSDIYRSKPFPLLPAPHLTKTKDSWGEGTQDGCNEIKQRYTNKVLALPHQILNPALVHDSHLINRLRLCVSSIIPVSSAFCFSASRELLIRRDASGCSVDYSFCCRWVLMSYVKLLGFGI